MSSNSNLPKINLAQKTMAVLEFMSNVRRCIPLKAISRGVNLPAATTHRIVASLLDAGYVKQNNDGEFYLTYKLLNVAGKIVERDDLIDRMYPIINYFTMTTDCGMSLTALTPDGVISLASIGGPLRFCSPIVSPGSMVPVYCSAVGKLYLSDMTDEELDEYLKETSLLPFTMNTITDPEKLREDIVQTRERGYAVIRGEFKDGFGVVAIPIVWMDGKITTALNFSLPLSRFDEICNPEFVSHVKKVLSQYLNKE